MNIFAHTYIVCIFLGFSSCDGDSKAILHERLAKLKLRAQQMYGEVVKKPPKVWEFELEDRLAYPRADKSKLADISKQWLRYYECSVQSLERLTAAGALPAVSLAVYSGAVARVRCGLCLAPRDSASWVYAESLLRLIFTPLELRENMVSSNGELVIYNTMESDAGVYKCQVGRSEGGLTVLEVLDYEEPYQVVKPKETPMPVHKAGGLGVRSAWEPWGGCARCGRWARRRRVGTCRVFIPVPCKENVMFSLITSSGVVLERANNSAGIYSLAQTPPPQPPPPARSLVFAVNGVPGLLRCPGTCLSDAPVVWRAGSKPIIEASLARDSDGRVTVNARDHLEFKAVFFSDTNLYSCWQQDTLCGQVKLEVWQEDLSNYHRILLLLGILGGFYTLRALARTYRLRLRRMKKSVV